MREGYQLFEVAVAWKLEGKVRHKFDGKLIIKNVKASPTDTMLYISYQVQAQNVI
jgi:hypothetical protein